MRCESCGLPLQVNARQGRRVRAGHSGSVCSLCRGRPRVVAGDSDYRYWLNRFGMNVPVGIDPLAVAASGMPPALVELAKGWAGD